MRTRILMLVCLCGLSLSAMAQKIESDELDDFTGSRKIETSWEILKRDSKTIPYMVYARFCTVGQSIILELKLGTWEPCVIGQGDKLLIKDSAGTVHGFKSLSMYTSREGGGSINILGSGAQGVHARYEGDTAFLSSAIPMKIRYYYGVDTYRDFDIIAKYQDALPKLYRLITERMGLPVSSPLPTGK